MPPSRAPQPKEREGFRATEDDVRRLRGIAYLLDIAPPATLRALGLEADKRDARYLRRLADRLEPNP